MNRTASGSFAIVLTLALLVTDPARAAVFRSGDEVTIGAEEIIDDDLYVSADSIVVNGVVRGDLIAFGRHIVLNGVVLGDLTAAGQGIVVNGQVADDVRLAGMALRLGDAAEVTDDILATGFSIESEAQSLIGGSFVFRGFQALLRGEVRGTLDFEGETLRLDGLLVGGGRAVVGASDATPPAMQTIPSPVAVPLLEAGFSLGPNVRLMDELTYTSRQPAMGEGSSSARLRHVQVEDQQVEPSWLARSLRFLWQFVVVLLTGLFLLVLFPGWLRRRADLISSRPWAALGWGALGVLLAPVAVMLVFVLGILLLYLLSLLHIPALVLAFAGLWLLATGSMIVGFLGSLFLVGPAVVSLWIGHRFTLPGSAGLMLGLLVGWIVLAGILVIPKAGLLLGLLLVLPGLGSVVAWSGSLLLHRDEQ